MREPESGVVGMLDEHLRIVLGAPVLARYLEVTGPLEGRSILELLEGAETLQALRWVAEGVISHATIVTLPGGGKLVAEMALLRGERWVVIRHREEPITRNTLAPVRIGGRAPELAAFEAFLSAQTVSGARSIFMVEGPLGIGKTTLLAAFRQRCDDVGCICFTLDANAIAPNNTEILRALYLGGASGAPDLASLFATATKLVGRRFALFIDNFDAWTRQTPRLGSLFDGLSESCRIVVAGRRRPKRSWWGDAPRVTQCTVGPLSEIDALYMARGLHIDVEGRQRALKRTIGHPLSIVRLAPTLASDADRDADALDRVVSEPADWLTRDMMELASLPLRVTEDLLGELLEDEQAGARLYDTLTEVCIPSPDGVGLVMPEAIRGALRDTLGRRNPGRFATLRRRVALFCGRRLDDGASYALDELVETLAEHPPLVVVLANDDTDIAIVRAEGAELVTVESALGEIGHKAVVDELAPELRARTGTGFVLSQRGNRVAVAYASPLSARPDLGPRRAAAQLALRRATDDVATAIVVHVMLSEDAADDADVRNALARLLFPITLASRGLYAIVIAEGPPTRLVPWGEHTVVGRFHVTIQDTRKPTARVVEELLSTSGSVSLRQLPSAAALPAVASDDIRFALTYLGRPDMLATSPLAALEICAGDDPAKALQELLLETLQAMNDKVVDQRLAQIMTAVYVEKAGKHEQIAIELGIPYGTFRRHLNRGLERVRELLMIKINAFAQSTADRRRAVTIS